ncbi:MAG TPA: FlgD immunoglobulin-like domain containing protein [Solirubrobacteraceae bacterium]
MSRLPVVAFVTLAVATVGAFFVTQHLKVTTPLISGFPAPAPSWINPADGVTCQGVNHRRAFVSFYLQHRSDDVDVYIVDQSGTIVRTIATGRHMRRGVRKPDGVFSWNGREDNGQVAPDGVYYFRVALVHQGRTADISNQNGPEPITVRTIPPRPVVTSVTPSLIPQGDHGATIRYTGNQHRGPTIKLYRTDLPSDPVVKQFRVVGGAHSTVWDGKINQQPAPAGTYLVGMEVTDQACNTGHFPLVVPPVPGTTPHAGVTVRYLAAEPPVRPVPAGSTATVYVDARQQRYRWALRRAGAKKVLGHGATASFTLNLKVPSGPAGLYELALRSGPYRSVVPIVASVPAVTHQPRVLVVLPALTWQGLNPVDDNGDGLPNTLEAGDSIALNRPLANGFPAGGVDEASLLAYLDKTHRAYDLTTDVGLVSGFGPSLAGHTGVVLAGSLRWLPGTLASTLRAYVENGGHVMSLGTDSMLRSATVRGERAVRPTNPTSTDPLGARPGPVVTHSNALVTVIRDGLGIFAKTSGAFPGFHSYQPFRSVAAPGEVASEAGATTNAPSIVGYRLGRGTVVDIGLIGFGSSLVHNNVDAQELTNSLWQMLSR